jgi:ribonuclease P protein component
VVPFEEAMGEAHIPTEQPQAQAQARVPSPDADPRRSGDAGTASGPRPQEPVGLIWRVRSRRVFAAFRTGRIVRRRHLSVSVVSLSTPTTPPQVAYAIGRPVGSAPVRNRVRRRLRAVTREHADLLAPGHAYLVQVRPSAARTSFSDLRAELVDLFTQSAGPRP